MQTQENADSFGVFPFAMESFPLPRIPFSPVGDRGREIPIHGQNQPIRNGPHQKGRPFEAATKES